MTVHSEEVTGQVRKLSAQVVQNILTSKETQQWSAEFSKVVVADLIRDPNTINQVCSLLSLLSLVSACY